MAIKISGDPVRSDSKTMRGERPFVMTNLKTGEGLDTVVDFIVTRGMLDRR